MTEGQTSHRLLFDSRGYVARLDPVSFRRLLNSKTADKGWNMQKRMKFTNPRCLGVPRSTICKLRFIQRLLLPSLSSSLLGPTSVSQRVP